MAVKASEHISLVDITDAYSVILTSEAYTFVGNTSGAPSGLSCTTQVISYCGGSQCTAVTIGTVTCPTGITATISNNGSSSPTITFKTTATVTTACEASIPVSVDGVTVTKKFSFAVAKTGATGSTGQSVSSITDEYYLSTSKTTQSGGSWTTTPPTWSSGKYIWTRSKIVYKNPSSTEYTTPICDSSWEAVNEIEVGGRNLVIGTSTASTEGWFRYGWGGSWTTYSSSERTYQFRTVNGWSVAVYDMTDYVGETITISCDVYLDSDSTNTEKIQFVTSERSDSTNTGSQILSSYFTFDEEDTWYHYENTITLSKPYLGFYVRGSTSDAGTGTALVRIKNIKFEKGNKATDWTPAPEDVEAKIEEVSDALDASMDVIVGTQTSKTGSWTGKAKFSTLNDGQRIAYWLPYAGSGNATLNLTLSTGSTTGAVACYYGGTTRITTHYPAGSVIHLTYRKNISIAGSGSYTGWWADANYDSGNTYDRTRYSQPIKAGSSAIVAGNIIVAGSGNTGTYTHLKLGNTFDVSYPILYASSAIAASATGTNNYLSIPFTVTTTQNITLTAYKSVYIKGILAGTTFTPFSTAPLTQTIPTSADNYYYILLGTAYSTTGIYLLNEHPIFKYYNGAFKSVQQIASEAASTADTAKNNAANAQSTADTARNEAAEAAKVATNYLNFDGNGLVVGDLSGSTLYRNIRIDSDSIDIRNGSTVLASYSDNYVYLGKNNANSVIDLCNGKGIITNNLDNEWMNELIIKSNGMVSLTGPGAISMLSIYNGLSSRVDVSQGNIMLETNNSKLGNGYYATLDLESFTPTSSWRIMNGGNSYASIVLQGADKSINLNADAIYLNGYKLGIAQQVDCRATIPVVRSDGVMEIGKYIDFHDTNYTGDYSHRLYVSGTNLISNGGEFITTNPNGLRIVYGNYGVMLRNDGTNYYYLITNSGNQYGTWNSLRPFTFSLSSGVVNMENGLILGTIGYVSRPGYSTSWKSSHQGTGSIIRQTSCTGWNPWLYVRGSSGTWTQGVYSNTGYYYITYASDTLIASSSNTTTAEWQFRPDGVLYVSGTVKTTTLQVDDMVELYGSTPCIDFHYNSTANYTSRLIADTSTTLTVGISGKGYMYTFAPLSFRPYADTGAHCGYPSYRWNRVYASNATISTSDEKEKNIIGEFDDRHENFFMKLKPIQYKWKNFGNEINPHDRIHFGLGAQTTLAIAKECGLDEMSVAAICRDDLDEPTVDGRLERYGMAYEELIPLSIHMIHKAFNEVESSKARTESLEYQLEQAFLRIKELEDKITQM